MYVCVCIYIYIYIYTYPFNPDYGTNGRLSPRPRTAVNHKQVLAFPLDFDMLLYSWAPEC